MLHAKGHVSVEFGHHVAQDMPDNQNTTERQTRPVDPVEMWQLLDSLGIQHGPTFRNLGNIHQSKNEELQSISTIAIPDTSMPYELPRNYIIISFILPR